MPHADAYSTTLEVLAVLFDEDTANARLVNYIKQISAGDFGKLWYATINGALHRAADSCPAEFAGKQTYYYTIYYSKECISV